MKKSYIIFLSFCLFSAVSVQSYVASSTNYRLQADSVNLGGGLSTSTEYFMEDTLGEIGTGTSSEGSLYNISAGYQAMISGSSLTVTSPADFSLSPEIDIATGGESTGSAVWNVLTDNLAGYSFSIKASTDPALKSASDSFADYTQSFGDDPDYNWTQTSSEARFGFSPKGEDLVQKYKDNGSACNIGSLNTADKCWKGLSTSNEEIAVGNGSNLPAGVDTTIHFKAEIGSEASKTAGEYSAQVTVTVVPL